MLYPQRNKKTDKINFSDLKEQPINSYESTHKFFSVEQYQEKYLTITPQIVKFKKIEKDHIYEIPMILYNNSSSIMRFNLKFKEFNYFSIEYNKTRYETLRIIPGLSFIFNIIFECSESGNYEDTLIISAEDGLNLEVPVSATSNDCDIYYEPFLNFGIMNEKKVKTLRMKFENNSANEVNLFLRHETSHSNALKYDMKIVPEKIILKPKELSSSFKTRLSSSQMSPNKKGNLVKDPKADKDINNKNNDSLMKKINFNVNKSSNKVNKKINIITVEVTLITNSTGIFSDHINIINEKNNEVIGKIEVVGSILAKSVSLVFPEGGSSTSSEINFGMCYFGQQLKYSSFLVNNSNKEIQYHIFFHQNKKPKEIDVESEDLCSTPQQAGLEMHERVLYIENVSGVIKPYSDIPLVFHCKLNKNELSKGFRYGLSGDSEKIRKELEHVIESTTTQYYSTIAIKFIENSNKIKFDDDKNGHDINTSMSNRTNDDNSSLNGNNNNYNGVMGNYMNNNSIVEEEDVKPFPTIVVLANCEATIPEIIFDKTMINFWECNLGESKLAKLTITNKNSKLPLDFSFSKVRNFQFSPNMGEISTSSSVTITITFTPSNLGNYTEIAVISYIQKFYSFDLKMIGECIESNNKINKNKYRSISVINKDNLIHNDNKFQNESKPASQRNSDENKSLNDTNRESNQSLMDLTKISSYNFVKLNNKDSLINPKAKLNLDDYNFFGKMKKKSTFRNSTNYNGQGSKRPSVYSFNNNTLKSIKNESMINNANRSTFVPDELATNYTVRKERQDFRKIKNENLFEDYRDKIANNSAVNKEMLLKNLESKVSDYKEQEKNKLLYNSFIRKENRDIGEIVNLSIKYNITGLNNQMLKKIKNKTIDLEAEYYNNDRNIFSMSRNEFQQYYQEKTNLTKSLLSSMVVNNQYSKNNSFLTTTNNTRLVESYIKLPEMKDNLWVIKPIGKWEPEQDSEVKFLLPITKDENIVSEVSKESQIITNLDSYFIYKELEAISLRKIQVNTSEIDFGNLFKNSVKTKTFWIKNNLVNPILVEFEIEQFEFRNSYPTFFILKPGSIQGCNLIVQSNEVKKINTFVKYTLNKKHNFKLKVSATITHANLRLSIPSHKFDIRKEKIMNIPSFDSEQELIVYNDGNAPIHCAIDDSNEVFVTLVEEVKKLPKKKKQRDMSSNNIVNKYKTNKLEKEHKENNINTNTISNNNANESNIEDNKSVNNTTNNLNKVYYNDSPPFIITPTDFEVPPFQNIRLLIQYKPEFSAINSEIEKDFTFNIDNGFPFNFKVSAFLPKSALKMSSNKLDFGYVHVGEEKELFLYIFNELKTYSIYKIVNPYTNYLSFTESVSYVKERRVPINVKFSSTDIIEFKENINILVRGGESQTLQISANVIVPEVEIEEENFYFGKASFGEKVVLPLTFINKSPIHALVIVDLRADHYRHFRITPKHGSFEENPLIRDLEENDKLEKRDYSNNNTVVNTQGNEINNNINNNQNNNEDFFNNKDLNTLEDQHEIDKESLSEKDAPSYRYFEVEIDPENTYELEFLFEPSADIAEEKISLSTNFSIKNYNQNVRELQKEIRAEKIESKINILPEKIDFGKSFIFLSKENPSKQELKIFNLGLEDLEWKVLITPNLDHLINIGVYSFNKTTGKIISDGSSFDLITLNFQPINNQVYEENFVIYVKTKHSDSYMKAKTVVITGEGIYPRVFFDRREVIFPVVPLNMESKVVFKIKNDGYEECDIKVKVNCSTGNVPVTAKFIEGSKFDILVKELKVEAVFKTSKPISFTAKITFYELNGLFEESIFMYGTSENCFLTNYTYLDRNFYLCQIKKINDEIKLIKENNDKDVYLNNTIDKDKDSDKRSFNLSVSVSNQGGTTITSNINNNYKIILKKHCTHIVDLLKYFLNSDNYICSVSNFPADIANINNKGEHLLQFIRNIANDQTLLLPDRVDYKDKKKNKKDSTSDIIVREEKDISIINNLQGKKSLVNQNINKDISLSVLTNKQKKQSVFNNKDKTPSNKMNSFLGDNLLSQSNIVSNNKKQQPNQNQLNYLTKQEKENQQIKEQYNLMKKIITYLQSIGGCLSTVLPEYLLEYDQLKKYLQNEEEQSVKKLSNNWEKILQKTHPLKHIESWIFLIYQIIKIFLLHPTKINNKILGKNIKHLPEQTIIEQYNNYNPKKIKSNLFNEEELLILKWVSIHISYAFPSETQPEIIDFQENFKEGKPIFSILKSFFPSFNDSLNPKQKKVNRFMSNSNNNNNNVINSLKNEKYFDRINTILKEFGIYTHINSSYIENPINIEIEIFLLLLFYYLPGFQVKDNIVFSCILNDEISKAIVVGNPYNNKKIEYLVKKEGSEDFSYKFKQGSSSLVVEANETNQILVNFKSKVFESVEGRLYLINRADNYTNIVPPLVYNLKSLITNRRTVGSKFVVKCPLYSKKNFNIPIINPLGDKGDFDLHIEINKIMIKKSQGNVNHQISAYNSLANSSTTSSISCIFNNTHSHKFVIQQENKYKNFYFKQDEDKIIGIKIDGNSSKDINISFIPLELCIYECFLIFVDPKIGEFQYCIEGQVTLPDPCEKLELDAYIEEQKEIRIDVNMTNKFLDNAMNAIKMFPINLEKEKKINTNNKLISIKNAVGGSYNKSTSNTVSRIQLSQYNSGRVIPNDRVSFYLESNSVYFTTEAKITLDFRIIGSNISNININNNRDEESSQRDNKENNGENNNVKISNYSRFFVKFNCKYCSKVQGDLILQNSNFPNDIRIYRVIVKVKPQKVTQRLEFNIPLNEEITQEIPFNNFNSDKDHFYTAELLNGKGTSFYINQNDLKVVTKSSASYFVKYKAKDFNQCTGTLTIKNHVTEEIFEYYLKGYTDLPLAEAKLEFTCNAKEEQQQTISIKNRSSKDITYRIETDLADILTGLERVTIKPNTSLNYIITIKTLLGKVYFGKISFIDESNSDNMIWYTIKITSKSVYSVNDITILSLVRKTSFVELSINNPTNSDVIFNIDYEGDYLTGEKEMFIKKKQEANYKLFFSPAKLGTFFGKLHIYNDTVGEYLYRINMVSESWTPIKIPIIKSELGKYTDYTVLLENPIEENVEIKTNIENRQCFSVIPEKIILPPLTSKEVIIRYTPTTYEEIQESTIVFSSSKIDKWEYIVQGTADKPTISKNIQISTYVGGIICGNITFSNPFSDRISVTIELVQEEETKNAFKLMTKSKNFTLTDFKSLTIPFSFSPTQLIKYSAVVYVKEEIKNITWEFLIEGVTEIRSNKIDFSFKTKAKKGIDTKIAVMLTGTSINKNDKFDYYVNVKKTELSELVNKCLNIELLKRDLYDTIGMNNSIITNNTNQVSNNGTNTATKNNWTYTNNNELIFDIRFYPLKRIETDCEFIINKKSGGRWVFNISLLATEPEIESVIKIQSALNKVAHTSFNLNNLFTKNEKFKAYFTYDSCSEFNISPRTGILDQSGREGTKFLVSYLPREYGKVKKGKLIIETNEIEWIFEVLGNYLDYELPKIPENNFLKETTTTRNRMVGFANDYTHNNGNITNYTNISHVNNEKGVNGKRNLSVDISKKRISRVSTNNK